MTSTHVEFTRDGRYALASLWEQEGGLIIYDAQTLEENKRIPLRKPSGKYNLYNKIHRSAGISHSLAGACVPGFQSSFNQ